MTNGVPDVVGADGIEAGLDCAAAANGTPVCMGPGAAGGGVGLSCVSAARSNGVAGCTPLGMGRGLCGAGPPNGSGWLLGKFEPKIVSRQEGFRRVLRWIKEGIPFYYLPDLDFGPKGSVFVPFFGVPAATARGLPYIARSTGAKVVPCVARMLPGGGYVAQLYPAWSDFPSGDDVSDARRMMAFVEERVREMPEQYHWLHKRFKTRPEGEPKFY